MRNHEVKVHSRSCDDKHIGLMGIHGAKLEEINSTDPLKVLA